MMSQQDLYTGHIGPGQMEPDEEDLRRPDPFPYSESEDIVLPEDYMPTKHDVINGRGRKSYNHIANRRFRQLISMNLNRYLAARCKVDKTLVVVGIVNTIRNATPTGAFLKRCPKKLRWISMSDESAREKVGHCLRDMIASQREDKKLPPKDRAAFGGTAPKAASNKNSSAQSKVEEPALAMPPVSSKKPAFPPQGGMGNPWIHGFNPGEGGLSTHPRPRNSASHAPFASMWSAVKNEITDMPRNKQQKALPFNHIHSSAPDPPPQAALQLNLNNLDTITLSKGNLQDMSEQQRKILMKLEGGFKGTVEELMEAVN